MHVQTQLLFPLSIFAAGWTPGDRSIILLFPRGQKYKAQTVGVQENSAVNLNRMLLYSVLLQPQHISSDGYFAGKQITTEEFLSNGRLLTLTFGCTSTRWTTSTQTPQSAAQKAIRSLTEGLNSESSRARNSTKHLTPPTHHHHRCVRHLQKSNKCNCKLIS